MAAIVNARDVLLQDASTRVEAVTLPSNYDTSGDHSGTLNGSDQVNFQNNQLSLTSNGRLFNGATLQGFLDSLEDVGGNFIGNWEGVGRTLHRNDLLSLSSDGQFINNGTPQGQISNLDYGNVGGTKPPSNATSNFFTTSGSNPSGGSDGDAHWNSSTFTMWFKTNGVWRVGGTINANQITVGTLAAGRIASNSITTDKINIGGALSNLSSNIGTISSGTLTSSVSLSVNGSAVFNGSSNQGFGAAAVNANTSLNSTNGVIGRASFGSGVYGTATSGIGVLGQATSGGGVGGQFSGSGGANALEVFGSTLLQGSITISTQTISNLTAGAANFVSGSNVSGTVGSAQTAVNASSADSADFASNSSQLNGLPSSSYCRFMVTDSGTATASSTGFVYQSTVTGVRVRATGGRNFVVEEFSDEELKINENPETLGLDFILGLEPVTYERQDNPGITYHGIGARKTRRHLEKIKKRKNNDTLGRTLEDGTESASTIGLIAPLVKAVQELNEKVEILMLRDRNNPA